MTDTQLCEYIDSLEQSHKEELRPAEIIERFICDLSESDSPRLSKGTIAKIRQIAANRGTA